MLHVWHPGFALITPRTEVDIHTEGDDQNILNPQSEPAGGCCGGSGAERPCKDSDAVQQ